VKNLLKHKEILPALGLFLGPALLALLGMRLVPAVQALVESLFKTNVFNGTKTFVGLENYFSLFENPDFQNTLVVTLLFTLIVNPFQVISALALSLLFVRKFPFSRLLRSLVIFPVAVPPAVSAVMWSAMYRPDGLLNSIFKALGLPTQGFILDEKQALISIVVMLSWIGVGYWMLFLIAGINDIPDEIYEAATLDGAGYLRTTVSVTLPMLSRPLSFVLVATTISNFLVFAPVLILTKGGPNGSTSLLMHDIFIRAYSFGDIGRASAAVFVLIGLMAMAVSLQFFLMRRGNDQ
jgi:multiple sugar transport system permease protein